MSILLRKRTVSVCLSNGFDTIDFQSKIESSCYFNKCWAGTTWIIEHKTYQTVDAWVFFKHLSVMSIDIKGSKKRIRTWSKHDIGARKIIASILSKYGAHAANNSVTRPSNTNEIFSLTTLPRKRCMRQRVDGEATRIFKLTKERAPPTS